MLLKNNIQPQARIYFSLVSTSVYSIIHLVRRLCPWYSLDITVISAGFRSMDPPPRHPAAVAPQMATAPGHHGAVFLQSTEGHGWGLDPQEGTCQEKGPLFH